MRAIFLLVFTLFAHALLAPSVSAADEKSVLGGTVYQDRNRNGAPDGEQGVRGVTVSLTSPKLSRRDTTDSKGAYEFNGLPAGDYTISVVPPAGQQVTTSQTVTIRADGRNANRVIDFGLAVHVSPTATPSPTASPTPRATATSTAPVAVPAAASPGTSAGTLPIPIPRSSVAGSPQPLTNTEAALQAALVARASVAGSPVPVLVHTVTPTATPTAEGGRGGVPDASVRLRAASLEPLRYAPGRDRLAMAKRWEGAETVWLGVPFRTQMDGTYFSQVNCGPASLSMAMGAFGISLDPHSVREYVNFLSGNLDGNAGTSLDHLARVAREAGIKTLDLYSSRGYRTWDLDLVRQHVAQGHPVITLTKYQSLPGNAGSRFETDHYVVITGLNGDDFIYNDPAYGSNAGYGLLISGADLERAWVFSSIPGHSMALAVDGDTQVPEWVRRRAAERARAVPGPASPTEQAEEASLDTPEVEVEVQGNQPFPEVSSEALAVALLDALVAPRAGEHAYLAGPVDEAPLEPTSDTMTALAPGVSDGSVRLAQVFIFDPTLILLFVALLGIFIPPALRQRGR